MAAATGPALWPGASTFPGTGVYPGQGNLQIIRVRLAFGSPPGASTSSTLTPGWVELDPDIVRGYQSSSGREQDWGEFSAGSCTLTLDNRSGDFSPANTGSAYYPKVGPMNQVWVYSEFNGVVEDRFHGYVHSYSLQWPGTGSSDAVVVLECSDEMFVLAMEQLPITNPPRETYDALVSFDNPDGFWSFNDDPATVQIEEGPADWEFPGPPDDPPPPLAGFIRIKRHRWPH